MKTKGKPKAANTHTLKQAYALGFKEADGDMGMTYDNDPGSPRSVAYDKGRTAGQKALEEAVKPSPLPWRVDGSEPYELDIVAENGEHIAKVLMDDACHDLHRRNHADAALIVRAVNAHAGFVEALRVCIEALDCTEYEDSGTVKEARAALRAAGEEV